MTVGVMAVVAQHEREAISARTKAALAAARVRGTKLGRRRKGAADISTHQPQGVLAALQRADAKADELRETMEALKAEGLSLHSRGVKPSASPPPELRRGPADAELERWRMAALPIYNGPRRLDRPSCFTGKCRPSQPFAPL